MADSEWRSVHGTLMTSEPIAAYGGISIPRETLRDLAQQINASSVPFHLDHDLSKPLRIRRFEAFVEGRADGIDELKFRAELHKGDVHLLESRASMSATMTAPLSRDEHLTLNDNAPFQLSADHAWFADEALVEAETQFMKTGVGRELIRVQRAYQFSFVPDPQIYIDIAYALLMSVSANAVWDGIKGLFARRKTPKGGDATTPTVVNVSIVDGDRSLRAIVTTGDEAVARRAIESLDEAATTFFRSSPTAPPDGHSKSITVWDDESHTWTPPN